MSVTEAVQLGKYQLLRRIAVGGMAEVFLGRAAGPAGFSKLVAIKRIHVHLAHEEDFVEMFLDEARLASRLDHPNIVQIIDLGQVDEHYFLAMEYVHGKTLRQLINRATEYGKVIPADDVFSIAIGVLSALSFAHTRRGPDGNVSPVIHRDISPQNILIAYNGNVKLADFGIAKAQDRVHVTQEGMVKGKAYYMAPEQMYEGSHDHRVDLYAFGVVLHEMLTGRKLFGKYTQSQLFNPTLRKDIAAPSSVVPHRPRDLDAIVMKLLERDPERRYASAAELVVELEQLMLKTRRVASTARLGETMSRLFSLEMKAENEELDQATTPTPSLLIPAATTPAPSASSRTPPVAPTVPGKKPRAAGSAAPPPRTTPDDATDVSPVDLSPDAATFIKPGPELTSTQAVTNPAIRSMAILEGDGTELATSLQEARTQIKLTRDAAPPDAPGQDTGSLVQPVQVDATRARKGISWAAIAIAGALVLVAISISIHAFLRSPGARPTGVDGEVAARSGSTPDLQISRVALTTSDDARAEADSEVALRPRTPPPEPDPRTPPRRPRGNLRKGTLSVTARPPGKVYKGRRVLGTTPLKVKIAAGKHTLHLRSKAHRIDLAFRVAIQPGKETAHSVTVGKGTLKVNAIPWAKVFIDGKRHDVTPIKVKLYAGRHQVVLVFPGSGTERRHRASVTVRPGGEHKVIYNFLKR